MRNGKNNASMNAWVALIPDFSKRSRRTDMSDVLFEARGKTFDVLWVFEKQDQIARGAFAGHETDKRLGNEQELTADKGERQMHGQEDQCRFAQMPRAQLCTCAFNQFLTTRLMQRLHRGKYSIINF